MPEETLDGLAGRIADRTAQVGVVGLGYVGVPVAAVVADAGFRVIGVDVNGRRVSELQTGRNPFSGEEPGLDVLLNKVIATGRFRATTDYSELATADIILISVDTPVDADHHPRYENLRAACKALAPNLKTGALVIVESTISPGTIRTVVQPLLEGTSHARRHVGHCPERVMPGRLLLQLRTMPRVVGSDSREAAEAMADFYRAFVDADLDLTDVTTAELVKTAENAYRDVNIAFANELAVICERAGGDVWAVRELVNKVPARHVLLPGAGVGGHCIPKDSWLLASVLGEDMNASLLAVSRRVNDAMPLHIADLVFSALREAGVPASGARVAVLGYTYLPDSDDTRNSPSANLLPILEAAGCQVGVHDPFVQEYQGEVLSALGGADCAAVMVAHSEYRSLDLRAAAGAMHHALLVDGRNVFNPTALDAAGFRHRRIGTSPLRRAEVKTD